MSSHSTQQNFFWGILKESPWRQRVQVFTFSPPLSIFGQGRVVKRGRERKNKTKRQECTYQALEELINQEIKSKKDGINQQKVIIWELLVGDGGKANGCL